MGANVPASNVWLAGPAKGDEIDGERIRAACGHAVRGRIAKTTSPPPDVPCHGTPRRAVPAIAAQGLKPMDATMRICPRMPKPRCWSGPDATANLRCSRSMLGPLRAAEPGSAARRAESGSPSRLRRSSCACGPREGRPMPKRSRALRSPCRAQSWVVARRAVPRGAVVRVGACVLSGVVACRGVRLPVPVRGPPMLAPNYRRAPSRQ